MTSIPRPIPKILGHEVPESGSEGAVAVGPGVPAHLQSVSVKHCVFRQLPVVAPVGIWQIRLLGHCEFEVQVTLH